jgi:hypothetical protein
MNSSASTVFKVEIRPKGAPVLVDAVKIKNNVFIISGNVLKTATLEKEWEEDVDDPAQAIRELKKASIRIDILNFWQRIPETEPKYPYYREWREVAAIPITDFKHWWDKQVNCKTRNMVRKSQKMGVQVRQVEPDDDFVRGVTGIYNQSPLRRGKPFRHYGKDFETVKHELSDVQGKAIYVGAYHNNELIGFIQFVLADRDATVTLILDNLSHRDKAPMNGMIAKAIEICATRKIPYLTYTLWRRGEHGEFQKHNGFVPIQVPEYYVPLTLRGWVALRVGLHKGVRGVLPESMMARLLRLRANWYSRKFGRKIKTQATDPKPATSSAG